MFNLLVTVRFIYRYKVLPQNKQGIFDANL